MAVDPPTAFDPGQQESPAPNAAPTKAVHPLFKAAQPKATTSSSTCAAARADAPPPPAAAAAASSSSAAAPRKKTSTRKVDVDQGRLAFGKPGEGWKIEKAPPSPTEEDAPTAAAAPESAAPADGVGPGKLREKGSAKGKGQAAADRAKDLPAPKPKPAARGAMKGKGTDPETDEVEGMQSTGKTSVKAVPPKPKKRTKKGAVENGGACNAFEVSGQMPLWEHASPDLIVVQRHDDERPESAAGASSPATLSDLIAGPSKPRKKATTVSKPTVKAAPRPQRKGLTVVSSESETEEGSRALRRTGSTTASIIITEDEVEAASDASIQARSTAGAKAQKSSKTLHPFFGSKAASASSKRPKLTSSLGGSSAEFAIDVEAEVAPVPRPMSSFFSPRPRSKPAKPKPTAALEARWPTREETLYGEYSTPSSYISCPAGLSDVRRSKMREDNLSGASAFWTGQLPSCAPSRLPAAAAPPQPPAPSADIVVPEHLMQHPAFARLADTTPWHTPDLWTDRFRPLEAAEVLGNEDEAVYLRDWLLALQVKVAELDDKGKQKAVKRQVLRKVDKSARKRQKKARDDDWIVDDDELEYLGDPIEESSDEDSFENLKRAPAADAPSMSPSKLSDHYATQKRPQLSTATEGSKTSTYPPIVLSSLSNSILLVGPSGAGKTAAVYACANELGWDVFEVYPGVRRSGVALGEMVGEVGKNHLVGRGGTGGGGTAASSSPKRAPTNALTSLLRKSAKDEGFGYLKDQAGQKASSPFDAGPSSGAVQQTSGRIRQSCILLEEVDILFQDDKGFWPAVVSLISESRRPVIMTCNDLNAVPLDDLPLQSTLVFLPPPLEVAIPYLHLLTRAGELDVPVDVISTFHRDEGHHTFTAGVQLLTGHPAPSQPPDSTDLRRTIINLQTLRRSSEVARRLPPVEEEVSEARWDTWETQVADWASSTSPASKSSLVDLGPLTDDGPQKQLQQMLAVASHLDNVSFVNAHVDWRASDLASIFDPDRYAISDNDPVDYDHLLKPLPDPLAVNLPEHGFGRRLAHAALTASRTVYDQAADRLAIPGRTPPTTSDLLQWIPARRAHLSKLLDMLEPLIEVPGPLLPSPALVLDYVPFVQVMVAVDDVLEAEDKAQAALGYGRGKQGRMMRASAQAGMAALAKWTGGTGGRVAYQRQLYQLEDSELQAARDTRLVFQM